MDMVELLGPGMHRPADQGIEQLSKALHDFCQPLTTLQCRLEMAGVVGSPEAYREAVEQGLLECSRLLDYVGAMREIVRAAEKRAVEEIGQAV